MFTRLMVLCWVVVVLCGGGCGQAGYSSQTEFHGSDGELHYSVDSSESGRVLQEAQDIQEEIKQEGTKSKPSNIPGNINRKSIGDNPIAPSFQSDLQKELEDNLYAVWWSDDIECWMCETAVDIVKISGCSAISELSAYAVCGIDLTMIPGPTEKVCIAMAMLVFNVLCDIGLDVIEAELGVELLDSGYFCNVLYFHENKCLTEYTKCIPKSTTQYDFCLADCLCVNFLVQKDISLPTCGVLKAVFKKAYQKKLISFVCETVVGEAIKAETDCENICKEYKGILDNCGNFNCDSDESGDTCCIDCECTDGYFCTETIAECASSSCIVPAEVYSCVDENDCIGGNCEEPPDNPGSCPPDCSIPIDPCLDQKCGFKDGIPCGTCDKGEKCINGKCAITCGIDGCELDYGEDCCTCPLDCNVGKCVSETCQKEYCGDGICQYGEGGESPNKPYCYSDCAFECGDGNCESGENNFNCCKDCCDSGICCGGICCNAGEICDNESCPDSNPCIKSFCCTPKTCKKLGKKCGTWPDGCGNALDCGGCDSNSYCENGECKLYFDKGYCGDGWCVVGEDCSNCEKDCSCQSGFECVGGECKISTPACSLECIGNSVYCIYWEGNSGYGEKIEDCADNLICTNAECKAIPSTCSQKEDSCYLYGERFCTSGSSGTGCDSVSCYTDNTCCFTWSPFKCFDGYVCDDGKCKPGISVCTPTQKVCNGISVYQEDSCGWSTKVEDCKAGQYCQDGQCVNGCVDECTKGEIKCFGKTLYAECKFIDGCWQWDDGGLEECDYECKNNKPCIKNGAGKECDDCMKDSDCKDGYECSFFTGPYSEVSWCIKECNFPEDCPLNHACVGNACLSTNTEEECYNGDIWLVDEYCNKGQFLYEICNSECQNGKCVSGNNCTNECAEGESKCIAEAWYKTCKLINGCWQWGDNWSGNTFICPTGYKCSDSNGKCSEICSSEEKQCELCVPGIPECSGQYLCVDYLNGDGGHFYKFCDSNSDCPAISPVCKYNGICQSELTKCIGNDVLMVSECGAKLQSKPIKACGWQGCYCVFGICDCKPSL